MKLLLPPFYRYLRSVVREKLKTATRSPEWEKTRREFLKSNPTCAACGSETHLQVHHVKPFHLHPELELDFNNLITLCMSSYECHLVVGHGDNWKCFNPNVVEDAKKFRDNPRDRITIAEAVKLGRRDV